MKNRILLFTLLGLLSFACGNESSEDNTKLSTDLIEQTDGKFPILTFEKTEHDFGTIKEGEVVTYNFKFNNSGEAPLIVTDAKASCGCTIPEKPERPVAVGADDVITVAYNSENRVGKFNKRITITANTNPSQTKIYIKGEVVE